MKQKRILRLISTLILIILLFSVFSSCKVKPKEYEYIYFGEYPQTLKADDVVITSVTDTRGYYLGSDGTYYAKVVATPYETYGSKACTFSNGAMVNNGKEYYFKVEPIRWRILCDNDGKAFIMCDSIIANMAFSSYEVNSKDDEIIANDYETSDIRFWLNNKFYNIAFVSDQQEKILTTTVDNSLASYSGSNSDYVYNDTEDKIFLLSYADAQNKEYGFDEQSICVERQLKPSDYAKATGADMFNEGEKYSGNGCGYWLLRSPAESKDRVYLVHAQSRFSFANVRHSQYGIVPAMWIIYES